MPAFEILNPRVRRGPYRAVLFDFDGTLSLIREGWMGAMVPMMVDVLRATGTGELAGTLADVAREFVMELTGKQTIYQCFALADEIGKRGGIFAKHNLDVDILYTSAGPEAIQALISGSVDVATGTGVAAGIGTISKGAPIRIIGASSSGAKRSGHWLCRTSSGVCR